MNFSQFLNAWWILNWKDWIISFVGVSRFIWNKMKSQFESRKFGNTEQVLLLMNDWCTLSTGEIQMLCDILNKVSAHLQARLVLRSTSSTPPATLFPPSFHFILSQHQPTFSSLLSSSFTATPSSTPYITQQGLSRIDSFSYPKLVSTPDDDENFGNVVMRTSLLHSTYWWNSNIDALDIFKW